MGEVELSLFQISAYAEAAKRLTRAVDEMDDEDLGEWDLRRTDAVAAVRALSVAIAAESGGSIEQIRLSQEPAVRRAT
jgi:hypothetical protein